MAHVIRADFGETRLDALQHHAFGYFLNETNSANGLVADRTQPGAPASIAAVGFALAAYPVGVERAWMTRTGANDGIVSTASLMVGVARGRRGPRGHLACGHRRPGRRRAVNGGRRVRICQFPSRHRTGRPRARGTELATNPAAEEQELAAIYVRRGLEPALARTVAQQLMAHDALGAHARDELGLHDKLVARPLQAALASAATFAVGAALPILTVMLAPRARLVLAVSGASLMCLAALGALAARAGGASAWIGVGRVAFWGALAMAATAGVGALFGTTVS